MLTINVKSNEVYNEKTNKIVEVKGCELQLEHSLISISKWESKWCKPFLSGKKTTEETIDYIRCMTINNVDPNVYYILSGENIKAIEDYIQAPMTATVINDSHEPSGGSGRFITSELIYYYMITYNIPYVYEKWHLNRLITLIRICQEENRPKKKMSKSDVLRQNASINAARRAKLKKGK